MKSENQNPFANSIENASKEHDISEKFADLLNAQIFRLITNKTFVEEAEYIKKTCEKNNLTNIVDFGCWTGVLASEVFNTGLNISNYHMIDAVPYYVNIAKYMLSDKPITTECVTLIPSNYKSEFPKSILVHPYDTLNSSSIYSQYFLNEQIKKANVTVPVSNCQLVEDFVDNNKQRFSEDSYIKIDLDGVDIELVKQILSKNLKPGAIQFEVWNSFKGGLTKISQYMSKLGYKVPTVNLHMHQTLAVCCAKNYWWAVGYDNVMISPEITYYDMDRNG